MGDWLASWNLDPPAEFCILYFLKFKLLAAAARSKACASGKEASSGLIFCSIVIIGIGFVLIGFVLICFVLIGFGPQGLYARSSVWRGEKNCCFYFCLRSKTTISAEIMARCGV